MSAKAEPARRATVRLRRRRFIGELSKPAFVALGKRLFSQGNRIKKRGHPERSIGAGEGGGPMRNEGSRQMSEQRPVLIEHLFRTHGFLRLRAAPPSPLRRSAQDDRDFDASALPFFPRGEPKAGFECGSPQRDGESGGDPTLHFSFCSLPGRVREEKRGRQSGQCKMQSAK